MLAQIVLYPRRLRVGRPLRPEEQARPLRVVLFRQLAEYFLNLRQAQLDFAEVDHRETAVHVENSSLLSRLESDLTLDLLDQFGCRVLHRALRRVSTVGSQF